MTIFLCGFMGCGKTTVGEILAKQLGLSPPVSFSSPDSSF